MKIQLKLGKIKKCKDINWGMYENFQIFQQSFNTTWLKKMIYCPLKSFRGSSIIKN